MEDGSPRSLNKPKTKYILKKFVKEVCISNEYFIDLDTAFNKLQSKNIEKYFESFILCDIEHELIFGYKNLYSNRLLVKILNGDYIVRNKIS